MGVLIRNLRLPTFFDTSNVGCAAMWDSRLTVNKHIPGSRQSIVQHIILFDRAGMIKSKLFQVGEIQWSI